VFQNNQFYECVGRTFMYKIVNNVPISCHVCDRIGFRLGVLIELLNKQTYSNFQIVY